METLPVSSLAPVNRSSGASTLTPAAIVSSPSAKPSWTKVATMAADLSESSGPETNDRLISRMSIGNCWKLGQRREPGTEVVDGQPYADDLAHVRPGQSRCRA